MQPRSRSRLTVLHGACDPAVRTPYQPLVEALEPALAGLDADEQEPSAGHHPASLTRLLRLEASSPDAILVAARRAGLPADSIVEVERVEAAMFA
jgi:hypothetical protein